MRVPNTVRNILISVATLLVLFAGAGVAYVYFGGASTVKPAAKPTEQTITDQAHDIKPTAPGPNAPESVAIGALTSPVSPGSNSSITVKTNAGSTCAIDVSYNGVKSQDSGLAPKTADAYGSASWTWTVGSSVPLGNWPIKVTCVYHGRSAVFQINLQVAK